MSGIFETKYEEIEGLDDKQLTELLKQLLHLELHSWNLPRSAAFVSLKIDVQDGGEDGLVDWENWLVDWKDAPEKTDRIPCRTTLFQSKSGKLGEAEFKNHLFTGKTKRKKIKELKPRVKEVINQGGAYVLFYGQSLNTQQKQKHLKKVREGLKEGGITQDEARVEIYDANSIRDWTDKFISAFVYVKNCNGKTIPLALKTWELWNSYKDYKNTFFPNDTLRKYIKTIQECSSKSNSVLRILGHSGMGKTRLVLEAFRPGNDKGNHQLQNLSHKLLYYNAADETKEIINFVANITNGPVEGIIVVDNCDRKLHQQLKGEVERDGSKLSLITIDYEIENEPNGNEIRLREKDYEGITKKILQDQYSGLDENSINRICEFTQNFPKMAVLLAEGQIKNVKNFGELSDVNLVNRMLWGREQPDEIKRKILEVCAVFAQVGYCDNLINQRNFLTNYCEVDKRTFLQTCDFFIKKGIIEKRGRYIRLIPPPLAIHLAAKWWRFFPPEEIEAFLSGLVENGLDRAMCDRMRYLHFLPEAKELVEGLCGKTGPFGRAEVLTTERGSRLFRSLVEVNPAATVAALKRAFQSFKYEGFLKVTGETRRNIVFSLEKLCCREDTFPEAVNILLDFAVAENESYANNATHVFLRLFCVLPLGTLAGPNARINTIEETLGSDTLKKRELAVQALGNALYMGPSTINSNIYEQGGRAIQDERQSKILGEVFAYWNQCLERLSILAQKNDALAYLAKEQIAKNLRIQIHYKRFDSLEKALTQNKSFWPDALKAIKEAIRFDSTQLTENEKQQLQKWMDWLAPTKLPERLQASVGTPDFSESLESTISLAKELADSDGQWYEHLAVVLSGEQRRGLDFGFHLGTDTENPENFLTASCETLKKILAKERQIYVLGGFLRGMRDREKVSEFLQKIATDTELCMHTVELTKHCKPTAQDLKHLLQLLDKNKIKTDELLSFAYNAPLDHLGETIVVPFCEHIVNKELESATIAFDILFHYCYENETRKIASKKLFHRIFETPDYIKNKMKHWVEAENIFMVLKDILDEKEDKKLAETIFKEIIAYISKELVSETHPIEKIADLLLKHYKSAIWKTLSSELLAPAGLLIWNLHFELKWLIPQIPLDTLLAWCSEHEKAPVVLARIIPIFGENQGEWGNHAKTLLDKFGSIEDVRNAFAENMGTIISESLESAHSERIQLFESVTKHPIREVRSWANQIITELREHKQDISKKEKAFWEEFRSGIFPL